MSEVILFSGRGFEVTDKWLRTPRKSYAVRPIQYIAVERPLALFLLPPVIALLLFALVLRRYLFMGEIVTLVGICSAATAVALLFGTLKVRSLALRDEEVASSLGLITTLREVRRAVEQAMALRDDEADAP